MADKDWFFLSSNRRCRYRQRNIAPANLNQVLSRIRVLARIGIMDQFDYIIIGAGSAGCVLADRLSADGRNKILVLEAGGSDNRFWIKVPLGYGMTFFDRRVNWAYETEPVAALENRRIYWPRGKVIGGSSSINASVYMRGLPADYDDWRDLGNSGWGWSDVLPYFRRNENFLAYPRPDAGPLVISEIGDRAHPLKSYFFDAARELGLPQTDNINRDPVAGSGANGDQPEGLGMYQINIKNGRRWSAADAFLRPALKRGNVELRTQALVSRILIENGRAVGVAYRRDGREEKVFAKAEVILSGGSVNSPQLLQLSGIGPADLLQQHGINIVVDNAAVGAHLQDHLAMTYSYKAKQPTLNNTLRPLLGKLKAGITYLATRKGPLSISVNQCGGLIRSHRDAPRPDLQIYYNPVTYYGVGTDAKRHYEMDAFSGFILCFQPCRPTSTGQIRIRNADPAAAPVIDPNYIATAEDQAVAVAGARFIHELEKTKAFQSLIAEPIAPVLENKSDDALLGDFRKGASTVYHPTSTCRMGKGIGDAVVDQQLRVFGVDGLRVVDASVFPLVTSANTNAPTMMLAQKAADHILADAKAR
jgi:choline dehydrogenase